MGQNKHPTLVSRAQHLRSIAGLATAALLGSGASGAIGAIGCENGTPAGPTFRGARTFNPATPAMLQRDSGPPDATAEFPMDATIADANSDAALRATFTLCPDGMAPTFPSIVSHLLATDSCGSRQNECHSSAGALPYDAGGSGSLLDLSLDAQALYAEFVASDGGGYPSTNLYYGDGGEVVLRVAPGDAASSMLYIKLALPVLFDRRYGYAMPPSQLVCPKALETVKAWINGGAPAN